MNTSRRRYTAAAVSALLLLAACLGGVTARAADMPAFLETLKRPNAEQWEQWNERIATLEVKPFRNVGLNYVGEELDCIGRRSRYDGSAKLRFTDVSLRQHLVHYAPLAGRPGEYAFAASLDVGYEVLAPGDVYLQSNDEACYWHVFNHDDGSRGAAYSREQMRLDQTGAQQLHVQLYRAADRLRKGTNLLAGHHAYAIHDRFTHRLLGVCLSPGGIRRGWGLRDAVDGNMRFYPNLLFTLANLTTFELQFSDLRSTWEPGSTLTVALTVTDADGDTFALPRADVTAAVTGAGRTTTVPLAPVVHAQDMPTGVFAGVLLPEVVPARVELRARVVCGVPDGGTTERTVAATFARPRSKAVSAESADEPASVVERTADGRLKETRAVFSHAGWLATKANVDRTVEKMLAGHFNVLFGQFHYPGHVVLWDSALCPLGKAGWELAEGFDPLAYAVEVMHANGIEVHVILDCFTAPADWPAAWKPKEEVLRSALAPFIGEKYGAQGVCRLHQGYRKHMAELVSEVCTRYDIDGICMDLVRWGHGCFCERCKQDYHDKTKRDLRADYEREFPYPASFTEWHEASITAFVQALSQAARQCRPEVRVSNCAYTLSSPDCRQRTLQGQPTHVWLQQGLVDFALPMAYSSSHWRSVVLHKDYLRESGDPDRIVLLLDLLDRWPSAPPVHKLPALVVSQVRAAKRHGFRGFGFYHSAWLHDDIVNALAAGPFREQAVPTWTP